MIYSYLFAFGSLTYQMLNISRISHIFLKKIVHFGKID